MLTGQPFLTMVAQLKLFLLCISLCGFNYSPKKEYFYKSGQWFCFKPAKKLKISCCHGHCSLLKFAQSNQNRRRTGRPIMHNWGRVCSLRSGHLAGPQLAGSLNGSHLSQSVLHCTCWHVTAIAENWDFLKSGVKNVYCCDCMETNAPEIFSGKHCFVVLLVV